MACGSKGCECFDMGILVGACMHGNGETGRILHYHLLLPLYRVTETFDETDNITYGPFLARRLVRMWHV